MNDLLYSVGLDITDLKTSAQAAKEHSEDIKKGFKGFKDVLEFGGVGAAVFGFFKSVINYAENLKGPLDENTAAVKRFGSGITEIKTTTLSWGAQFLGFWNRAGEGLGELVRAAIDGTAAVKLAAETQRAAEEQEKQAAEFRLKYGEEAKRLTEERTTLEKAAVEQNIKGLTAQERFNVLAQDFLDIQQKLAGFQGTTLEKRKLENDLMAAALKVNEADAEVTKEELETKKKQSEELARQAAAVEKLNKLKFDALPIEQQIQSLEVDQTLQQQAIYEAKQLGLDTTETEIALFETGNKLVELRAKLTGKLADETKKVVNVEAERIKAIVASANAWLGGMATVRGGNQFNDMSDAALASIVSRNRSQAADVTNAALYGPAQAQANKMEAARLQFEADNAQSVLNSRASLRQNVSLYGVEGARDRFTGDPAQFDSLVQQWVSDTRTQSEILRSAVTAITDINARLSNVGLLK